MKLIAFILFSLISFSSFANILSEGVFRGSNDRGERLEIFIHKTIEREGSFLGIIFKRSTMQAFSYLIQPYDSGRYGMTPLLITEEGMLSQINQKPALSLKVNAGRITINPNNGMNKIGFNFSMRFSGKKRNSKFHDSIKEGFYISKDKKKEHTVDVVYDNDSFIEAVSSKFGTLNLYHVTSGLYVALNYVYTAGGTIEENADTLYAISIKEKKRDRILFINNFGNVQEVKKER